MTLYNCDSEEKFIDFKEEYSDAVADIGYSAIYIAKLVGKENESIMEYIPLYILCMLRFNNILKV